MKSLDSITLRTHVRASDANAVRAIIASTSFFSDEERAVAEELIEDRLSLGERSHYHFIFADETSETVEGGASNAATIGYACFGRIAGTLASFDLYWIAVHDRARGRGVGRVLIGAAENAIGKQGGARIYAETSSRAQYAPTRAFYERCGYRIDAHQADFYAPGDGKVVYLKVVGA